MNAPPARQRGSAVPCSHCLPPCATPRRSNRSLPGGAGAHNRCQEQPTDCASRGLAVQGASPYPARGYLLPWPIIAGGVLVHGPALHQVQPRAVVLCRGSVAVGNSALTLPSGKTMSDSPPLVPTQTPCAYRIPKVTPPTATQDSSWFALCCTERHP